MGSSPDYKSGGIATAKQAIENHQRQIEEIRRVAKLPGNAGNKDYFKKQIAYHQEQIKWQRQVIADWKKR